MLSKLRSLNNSQIGTTLIEMLVVVSIIGVIGIGANMAIQQVIMVSTRSPEHMTAIKQVENAFHWISRDVQQAQSVEPGLENGLPLTLTWVEWDNTEHEVIYDIAGDNLTRSHSINATSTTVTVVARYIDSSTNMTNIRLTTNGTFYLHNVNDSFRIIGGDEADTGKITISYGGLNDVTTGNATYASGTWTAASVGDNITFIATGIQTKGTWTAENMHAVVALTTDGSGDSTITGSVLVVTITAHGGEGSQRSETRVAKINPRPSL